jgi:hypothetical protein
MIMRVPPPDVGLMPGMPFEGGMPPSPFKGPGPMLPQPGLPQPGMPVDPFAPLVRNGGMARFPINGRFSRFSRR